MGMNSGELGTFMGSVAADAYPLTYKLSGNFTHLQNKTSGGTLIMGFNETANKTIDDLETRIADALAMALL